MLSRVASHLYWLSRYLERAENMARILDVGHSLALLSGRRARIRRRSNRWSSPTRSNRSARPARRPPPRTSPAIWPGIPNLQSSIANCLGASRENTRAVRGSVTSEMWETINDTWLQLQTRRRSGREPIETEFFDWVKERSHLFRGVTFATIRRDQPYHFIRLGTFLERADNTARILSVKQGAYRGDPTAESDSDYYSLSAVLRSVSPRSRPTATPIATPSRRAGSPSC
jgi:uncharacterized alpha-E superfamily protein